MIGFFPDPYPDELFYSICARYCHRAGYHSQTIATRDLFGSRVLVAIALPSSLNYLVSVLPPGHRYSVDQLIDEHTLLPFYAPFLPPERVARVRRSMAEESGGKHTHSQAGTISRGNFQLESLRYCPVCVAEDRRRYGETYWHRAHQAPGVIVCPHHATWLEPSSVYLQRRDRRKCLSTAERTVREVPARLLSTEEVDHQVHLWIAREARWLLDHSSSRNSPEELRARYHNLLFGRCLATYSGVVWRRELREEICNFYSDALLTELHCRLNLRGNWLSQLLLLRKNVATAHHPLHHLLVPRAYVWLLKHDREWVETSMPPPRPHIKSPSPIDWNRRAAEFAAAARSTAQKLKQAPGRPVRVSKSAIAQEIGVLPVLFIQAHHYPLTRAVLEEISESLDDWAVRRIQWAAECFRQAKQRPTAGQVLKLAVVTRRTTRKKPILNAALEAVMRTFETPKSKPHIPD